jgi:putative tricarboxylic transport membrane protein
VVVGLFAMAEVLRGLEDIYKGTSAEAMKITGKLWLTKEEWKRSIGPIWRGGIIGFVIGVLPGAGGTIASIMSYTTEKRISKNPEEFGRGAIEGVAGPEAANNSDTAGALVPLLTLGVPGGGATAVLMGAFIMYGVQPGPLLFQNKPELVWGLINSMYVGNVMLVILNLPLIGLFVRLLYIPVGILYPLIVTISAIGAYAINGSMVDLWLILIFGIIGYVFGKVDIPVAPLVLSLVLGGIMEQSFRQAMTISGGDIKIFYGSAITVTLLVMSVISVALPFIIPRLRALGSKGDES